MAIQITEDSYLIHDEDEYALTEFVLVIPVEEMEPELVNLSDYINELWSLLLSIML